jgi:hypothetical protein
MRLKRLRQTLEDEKIKVAYETTDERKVVLAVSTKPSESLMENIDESFVTKELGEILKKMLSKKDIDRFFLAFNLIPGVAKDSGDSEGGVQILREWLKSFRSKNFTSALENIINTFEEIIKKEKKKGEDLFSIVISLVAAELAIIRVDVNQLKNSVLLPALSKAKKISADELIKVLDKLASGLITIKIELKKTEEKLSKRLTEYIEGIAEIVFVVEAADRILPPDSPFQNDWKEILDAAAELKEAIKAIRASLEDIKSQYKDKKQAVKGIDKERVIKDIFDALTLSRLTSGVDDTSQWIEGWLDPNKPKNPYSATLSYLRRFVAKKVLVGESNDNSDTEIVDVPAAKEFQKVFVELHEIVRKFFLEKVLAEIETYPNKERQKIENSEEYRNFAEELRDIYLLLLILKEKFDLLAGSKKVYPILANLTEKVRQMLYKILEVRREISYYLKRLDYYLFAGINYNLAEPYEAVLQLLSDLAHDSFDIYERFKRASKDVSKYLIGKHAIEKLEEAAAIYKQTFRDYITYLVYRELANSASQDQSVYNKLCVTNIEVVIGVLEDEEKSYIEEVLKHVSRNPNECLVTLYVFLKQLGNLTKKPKENTAPEKIVESLEVLPFSKQRIRDIFYQKIENNLASIASIIREVVAMV